MSDREQAARFAKAVRLYAALRCDMESIDPDVESGDILTVVGDLGTDQWTALAERYGVRPPSVDTVEVVREVAIIFIDVDERFHALPLPKELLK